MHRYKLVGVSSNDFYDSTIYRFMLTKAMAQKRNKAGAYTRPFLSST